jgi:hypothetical protein
MLLTWFVFVMLYRNLVRGCSGGMGERDGSWRDRLGSAAEGSIREMSHLLMSTLHTLEYCQNPKYEYGTSTAPYRYRTSTSTRTRTQRSAGANEHTEYHTNGRTDGQTE